MTTTKNEIREEVAVLVKEELKEMLGDSYNDLRYNLIIDAVRNVYETSSIETDGVFNDSDIRLACQRVIVDYING